MPAPRPRLVDLAVSGRFQVLGFGRPQPVTGASLVAADDAIRAHSIRALSGSALALLLLLCCGIALALQPSEVTALHTTMAVVAPVCLALALLAFGQVADGRWRVRRPARAAGAASA